MDYPCGKFGDCSFSSFVSIVRTDRQTHTHTHTGADERLTLATVVGVSNKTCTCIYAQYSLLLFRDVGRLQANYRYEHFQRDTKRLAVYLRLLSLLSTKYTLPEAQQARRRTIT